MTSLNWLESAARWYGVLLLLTWGWAPLVRQLCHRLPDRGALVAKPLAMLAVIYPSWLAAAIGLLPYSTVGLWITLGLGAAVGWTMAARHRLIDRSWLTTLLIGEVISLLAFAGYLWLHGFTPEILYTEKPMDSAFLASSARSVVIPPPDPWFAGEPINYYYLGYLIHGGLTRLAAVPATTGFNLALATTFCLAVTAAVGLGYDVARFGAARLATAVGHRLAATGGALTAVFLVGAGNLYAAFRLAATPAETLDANWWDSRFGVGWRASRIVCDGVRLDNACPPGRETINEFPFFSFLLGDLHPHLMALPFTVVALALALNLLEQDGDGGTPRSGDWAGVVATGAVVGSLYGLNSWDYPIFLLISAAALWVGWARFSRRQRTAGMGTLAAASVIAWLPFTLRFVPPTGVDRGTLPPLLRDLPVLPGLLTAVGIHPGERTGIDEYLTIFGVPFAFALLAILLGLRQSRGTGAVNALSRSAVVFALLTLVVALLLPAPVLLVCGLPLASIFLVLRRESRPSLQTIALSLFAIGFALAIGVELFYIRDAFGNRMNTLFKVYYQVWTLFAVATGLTFVSLWRETMALRAARAGLLVITVLAVGAGLVYPVLASAQWARWSPRFAGWDGIDGIGYVEQIDPAELAAIRWLQLHARPDDVVLEAAGCSYRPNGDIPLSRVSAYTGIPTIVGWGHTHETQWRAGQPQQMAEIGQREQDVARLFAEPHGELLDRYGVTLLYVGRYERGEWHDECEAAGPYRGLAESDYPGPGWTLVFSQGAVDVFRRQSARAEESAADE